MLNLTGEKEKIIKARNDTNNAIASHNIDLLTEDWMDDIVIIRGNGSIIYSKNAARKVWLQLFESQPGVIYIRRPDEIIIHTDNLIAWEKGTWSGTNTYSAGGNYAAMWRKQNNRWLLQAELFVALQ